MGNCSGRNPSRVSGFLGLIREDARYALIERIKGKENPEKGSETFMQVSLPV